MKSICKFAYDYKAIIGEHNSGEYLVELEPCMSVREIVERFVKGMPLDCNVTQQDGEEFENDDIDNISQPDYTADRLDFEQAKLDLQGRFKSASEQVKRREPSDEKPNEQELAQEQEKDKPQDNE